MPVYWNLDCHSEPASPTFPCRQLRGAAHLLLQNNQQKAQQGGAEGVPPTSCETPTPADVPDAPQVRRTETTALAFCSQCRVWHTPVGICPCAHITHAIAAITVFPIGKVYMNCTVSTRWKGNFMACWLSGTKPCKTLL